LFQGDTLEAQRLKTVVAEYTHKLSELQADNGAKDALIADLSLHGKGVVAKTGEITAMLEVRAITRSV
jgi:hypothetical protein